MLHILVSFGHIEYDQNNDEVDRFLCEVVEGMLQRNKET